jgi:hypothetical protein
MKRRLISGPEMYSLEPLSAPTSFISQPHPIRRSADAASQSGAEITRKKKSARAGEHPCRPVEALERSDQYEFEEIGGELFHSTARNSHATDAF